MKVQLNFRGLFAAFVLSSAPAAQALDILHVGGADSADYTAFIAAQYPGATWVHNFSGLTAVNTVGGDLDRVTDFTVVGTHGGTGITVRSYMQSFDLIIIGNGVTSLNFVDGVNGADWASITKPILIHPSLAVRATGGRIGMLSGDNNLSLTYTNPADTIRVSTTPLGDAIFAGVTTANDLYNSALSTFTETIGAAGTFGGGELISSLDGVSGTVPVATVARGIVFWNAGVANGAGLTIAAKRAFFPLRNAGNSSINLTADGKIVLKNLIDQLLVRSAPVFLSPFGLTAKSGIASVNLSWTVTTGATSYNIKRALTTGGPYTPVSTPGSITGTTYTDSGLTNGTTYYYVVSGVNASAAESPDSGQASATAVSFIHPGIKILSVANSDSAAYQNFATNGQFANNTWVQKPTGTGVDINGNPVDNQIGGDLERITNFTGTNGGTGITVRSYLESFDLIIVGIPTTSGNFVDFQNGAVWASITKPIIFNSYVSSRSIGGRPGMFSGDNAVTVTFDTLAETVRVSSSPVGNALLAGVSSETDLYGFTTADTINGLATHGTGEIITRLSAAGAVHYGVVFWAAGDLTAAGGALAANRAFLPLKGSVDDLNADGKIVLGNLINQIQLAQDTPADSYGSWAATSISALDPVALPGFNQDADNDGIVNGLEWVLAGDPLLPDFATVLPSSTRSAANGLTLIFNRATATVPDGGLAVEWSTDLLSFSNNILIGQADVGPAGNSPTVDVDAPLAGQVTVNIPAANAPGGKIFARVRARH